MKEITLDELIADVQAKESVTAESSATALMIHNVGMQVLDAALGGKVTIHTDYDADGICSAYIMEKTLKQFNPECDVEVLCNDRRNGYGISPDIEGDTQSRHIFLDIGSNQLDLISEKFGADSIIIDHHLIENKTAVNDFIVNDMLCNPHALNEDDKENAQYCATGLAYRIFEERQLLIDTRNYEYNEGIWDTPAPSLPNYDIKLENGVDIMACIGTAADMVDVLDTHSYNRQIIRNGIEKINNADEQNTDFMIGYILAQSGIGSEDVTMHDLAFKTGAFLNSASRMSEITGENGSQRMYNAVSGGATAKNLYEISCLAQLNQERKSYVQELQGRDFADFINEQRFSDNGNIAVYRLPDNTPSSFCGLIASKLSESTDKAVICLSYSEEKGSFSGSGRNAEGNASLKEFLDRIMQTEYGAGLSVAYGGHHNAVGISRISGDDYEKFVSLVNSHKHELERSSDERVVLRLSPEEISSPETLEKLQQLEPVGTGLKIPPVIIEGRELRRNQGFLKGRSDWKKISVRGIDTQISDWSYSPDMYPQDKRGNIKLLAEVSISAFKGQHVELTAKWDRDFFEERTEELKSEKKQKNSITLD